MVCVVMMDEFLVYFKYVGNDLFILCFEYGFVGFKVGDSWCLCVV